MRRFIAYLLASITIFLGIGVAFKPIATSINADLDYRDGREITFRLTKDDEESSPIEDDGEAVKEYADLMENRLVSYGISDYRITTSGIDTIKVTLTVNNDEETNNISKLLTVNPKIEICNLGKTDADPEKKIDEIAIHDTNEYSWHDNKAYLTYNGASTILVMPIPGKAKELVDNMYENAKKFEGGDEPEPEPSNDDPKPEDKQSIILWMNRNEDNPESYDDKDNPNVEKKIIYDKFNTTNFYYGENKDAFQIVFNPTGSDVASIRSAYNKAVLFMNMLNAAETEVACTSIRTEIIPAAVENLLIYGTHVHIAMSATFIALIVAFIIISILLALFYRLSSIAIISTMSLNAFVAFTIFTIFKAPFNLSALVALIVVALTGVINGVIHNSYLHEEVYKGRNLKKANYEASKKTTMFTVDISVISAIVGILLYFVGGTSVASAGVILIISAVTNIFINTFVLKGLMWLLTNNTNYQDKSKYKLLNIRADKVPDLTKDEKPTYFGPFASKDFTKKKKITGIVMGVVTLATTIALIAFGATGKIFNTGNYYASTNEISFSIECEHGESQKYSTEDIKTLILEKIYHNDKPIKYNSDIEYYVYTYYEKEKSEGGQVMSYDLQCFEVTVLENNITANEFSSEDSADKTDLRSAVDSVLSMQGISTSGLRVTSNDVYNIPNNVGYVIGASLISIVVTSVYLLLRRFRASRVLSLAITSSVVSVVSLGLISLTRIAATPVMSIACIITMLVTCVAGLVILHKDKDLMRDEKPRDVASRKTILKKANALALLPLTTFGVVSLYSAVNFFGFGNKAYLAVFFAATFALIIAGVILLTLFTPMCDFFDEKFSRVKLPEIKIRKKAKAKEKSNEPEEAIFIGIND